jgi:hypothetical protein
MSAYKTVPQPEFLIKGTLNISPRVQIVGGGGEMVVMGRLNNFGQIDLDTVVFNGTTPQILGNFSGASGTIKILKLDNPAGLTMGSDQRVAGIRFVRGMLTSSSENLLTLTEGDGFVAGARNDAHVTGPVAVALSSTIGTRLFPIGSAGKYRPVLLENSSSSGESSNDVFIAEAKEGAPPPRTLPSTVTSVSGLRHYRIALNGGSGNTQDFRVTLPFLQDDGVTDPENLTIVKDNGAGAWLDIGGTISGPSIPGTIQSGVFNGFSNFVLANKIGGNNPLPVTWLSFEAERVNADAHLNWITAQEQRCSLYEIERSADGMNYQKLGQQLCRNSQSAQNYNHIDVSPGKGTFYYRIRQVDTDGKFEYSPVRRVSFGEDAIVKVFPNPVRGVMQMVNVPGNSDIRLYDATGRLVLQSRNAQPVTQMQVGHLPSGIYELLITTITGDRVVQKVQILR